MGSSGPPPGYPTAGNQQNYPSAGVKPADDQKAGGYGQQTGALKFKSSFCAGKLGKLCWPRLAVERSSVLGFTTVLILNEALESIVTVCVW